MEHVRGSLCLGPSRLVTRRLLSKLALAAYLLTTYIHVVRRRPDPEMACWHGLGRSRRNSGDDVAEGEETVGGWGVPRKPSI